ncbi:hypothetical protein DL93DRAFT_2184601 [Clavulina sp. PMI_390]|nr:hypothetical protein DL93DRAFT_2184601 [Clavulina sp. PMI_390]
MNGFHNHFKLTFRTIWRSAEDIDGDNARELKSFVRRADELYQHLCMHHDIEERYIFPVLSRRMPQFRAKTGTHLKEHKEMHAILDRYHEYLLSCVGSPEKWSSDRLHEIMSDLERVLFGHMDDEVKSLGADSMYASGWTEKEMREMPF